MTEDENKPGQHWNRLQSPDDLGRAGVNFALGALYEAAKQGQIPADLWSQIMSDAARFEARS